MDLFTQEKFIHLWRKYFNNSELPITFYYSDNDEGLPIVTESVRHRCIISQLNQVRKGASVCFNKDSIKCGGGKRYLSYQEVIRPRFENFLSHGEEDEECERYKRNPEQVIQLLSKLPVLPRKGDYLVVKRWDKLTAEDHPSGVIFFANADVLSGLFTLATFDGVREDEVMAPFGAGCTAIIYYPYREEIQGTFRSTIGMFDPSARKCAKKDIISFAVPITKFLEMIGYMEESFLITDTWKTIQSRID